MRGLAKVPWVATASFLLTVLSWGCRASYQTLNSGSVLFYAASSTTDVIEAIRHRYARQTGRSVELNFGATSTLATQIKHGSGADLFLAANESWVEHLDVNVNGVKKRLDLLSNRLVVVVPKNLGSPPPKVVEDLVVVDAYEGIAMANPDALVPAGIYAKEALVNLGLWDKLLPRMVYGDNVRVALRYVETQSVAAGIVYWTDALTSYRVQLALEISPSLHRKVLYPLLLLDQGRQDSLAHDLFDYLASPEAGAIFKRYGFTFLPRPK